jgi:hypothetical protein
MNMKGLYKIFGISALFAFLAASLTVFLPAVGALAIGWLLGNLNGAIALIAIAFFLAFMFFFIISAFIGFVWALLPRNVQIALAVIALVFGLLLFQPELDFFAIVAFAFTLAGVNRKELRLV